MIMCVCPPPRARVQLPCRGGGSEVSSLKCHGAWVGFCVPSVEEYSHLQAKLAEQGEEVETGLLAVTGTCAPCVRVCFHVCLWL